jgi:hypothetical protein
MPAGGTIAAAYCFERKCRHIPLEWQRLSTHLTLSYQEPFMPERSTSQFVQSICSAYVQEVISGGLEAIASLGSNRARGRP